MLGGRELGEGGLAALGRLMERQMIGCVGWDVVHTASPTPLEEPIMTATFITVRYTVLLRSSCLAADQSPRQVGGTCAVASGGLRRHLLGRRIVLHVPSPNISIDPIGAVGWTVAVSVLARTVAMAYSSSSAGRLAADELAISRHRSALHCA